MGLCYNLKSDIRFQLYFRSVNVNVMTTEKVEERATVNDERNKESLKLVLTLIVDYWSTRLKD